MQNSILVQKYRKFRDKFEDKADEDNKEAVGVTGELDGKTFIRNRVR